MTNIVPFRKKIVPSPHVAVPRRELAVAVASTVRLEVVHSGTSECREDIRKTVILLDLALQHARELSDMVTDERMRRIYDRHLASIEYSLQIARERLSAL
ncbi:hypothetical protein [Bradyrhizobium sp. HKCCYLR20261]|uniref:hypothetical protein n=1 Tax=unclassified Bradyrhizobium TaxID=2631580 RepID=UPI003EBC93CB